MNTVNKQTGFFTIGAVMLIFAFSAGTSLAIDSLLTSDDSVVVEPDQHEQTLEHAQIYLHDDDS